MDSVKHLHTPVDVLSLVGFDLVEHEWQYHALRLGLKEFREAPLYVVDFGREIRAFNHFGDPVKGRMLMWRSGTTIHVKLVPEGR